VDGAFVPFQAEFTPLIPVQSDVDSIQNGSVFPFEQASLLGTHLPLYGAVFRLHKGEPFDPRVGPFKVGRRGKSRRGNRFSTGKQQVDEKRGEYGAYGK